MSYSHTITKTDNATPAVTRLLGLGRPSDMEAVGRSGVRFTQQHLRKNPSNQRGWPSTGFWGQSVRSGNFVVLPLAQPTVVITFGPVGLAQHIFGGKIRSRGKKLTIPVAAEAYGKRAREFSDLKLVVIPGKGTWLAKSNFQTLARTKRGGVSRRGRGEKIEREQLKFMYRLVDEVDQPGHRERFPKFEDIAANAAETLAARADRLFKDGGAA